MPGKNNPTSATLDIRDTASNGDGWTNVKASNGATYSYQYTGGNQRANNGSILNAVGGGHAATTLGLEKTGDARYEFASISFTGDDAGQLSADAEQLSADARQLSTDAGKPGADAGQLSTDAERLSANARQLSATATQLSTDAGQLSATAGKLSATAGQLSATAGQLNTDARQLSADAGQLSTDARQLSTDARQLSIEGNAPRLRVINDKCTAAIDAHYHVMVRDTKTDATIPCDPMIKNQ